MSERERSLTVNQKLHTLYPAALKLTTEVIPRMHPVSSRLVVTLWGYEGYVSRRECQQVHVTSQWFHPLLGLHQKLTGQISQRIEALLSLAGYRDADTKLNIEL